MVKKESAQPELNIGMVGHVDHGKTTLLERLSGKWGDTHSEEMKRGITIRLGYADATIRKCPKCKGAAAFTVEDECPEHNVTTDFLRKISFLDAPGHESLMATMLSGATIMDGALLLIDASEKCPQPQTKEHLMALEIIGITKVVIVQNKIDLVDEEAATKNYEQIQEFIKDTQYKDTPIIPISAQQRANLDVLMEAIEQHIPTPKRDLKKDPILLVARSFDINKPGILPKEYQGGVLGGALVQGKLAADQDIEIRPGYDVEEKNQKVWKPIITKAEALMMGSELVKELTPGGSGAVLTLLDPSMTRSDSLAGSVVGLPGKVYPVWHAFKLEINLLDRVVGSKEDLDVDPIKPNEPLMLNVNAAATVGLVSHIDKKVITVTLKKPVAAEEGQRVTISRRIGNRFRLIGFGILKK